MAANSVGLPAMNNCTSLSPSSSKYFLFHSKTEMGTSLFGDKPHKVIPAKLGSFRRRGLAPVASLGGLLGGIFKGTDTGEATRQKYAGNVSLINGFEAKMSQLSDAELRGITSSLKDRAQGGESLDSLLPKNVQEDGRVLQESADDEEEILNLQMESDLNLKQFPRRNALALMLSSFILLQDDSYAKALPLSSGGLREYIDSFDGYSFKYPKNWIQVRGAGADIFFRDPFVLDENLSVDISSPSSSNFKSIEDLGPPQVAGEKMLKQYLTEFMSTRLGVRRESSIRSASSRVADDGKMYYVVEVNIKSYANNNELAVMPQDRVARLEWDRRYFSVLGVENKQLYELRLQTPENVFVEEESDLRQVMDSFRVFKVSV